MQIHDVVQGSTEWLDLRAKHYCASEAPAMLGLSKKLSRNDLLRMKATGDEREFSAWVRDNVLADGHKAEAAARPQVETFMQEDLFACTGTLEVDGLPLLASFDGVTMDESTTWENKLVNADLVEALQDGVVGDEYWPQLEHQLLVSGAGRSYFTAADTDGAIAAALWYESVPERRAKVIAGWRLFAEDMANYQPVEVIPAAVAAPIEDLPALTVEISGRVLSTNLTVWQDTVKARIQAISTDLRDDNDFATAESTVKFLEDGEKRLALVKSQAQAQAADIDTLFRTIDNIAAEMRAKRLELDKLVKARKESIRGEILREGQQAYSAHMAGLNKRLGKPYMPMTLPVDFAGAMKSKKTVKSLRDAVDTELASAKLAADEVADRIQNNLNSLRVLAADHAFLFADTAQLVLKDNDALVAIVKQRIAEHLAAAEAKRKAIEVAQQAAPASKQTETSAPPATIMAAPSQEGSGMAAAGVQHGDSYGALRDRIDDVLQALSTEELRVVLEFAIAVRLRRSEAAAA